MERAQRTHTEEFYEVHDFSLDLKELNQQLRKWEKICDIIRPNQARDYLTFLEYILRWKKQKGDVSGR